MVRHCEPLCCLLVRLNARFSIADKSLTDPVFVMHGFVPGEKLLCHRHLSGCGLYHVFLIPGAVTLGIKGCLIPA